MIAGASGHFQTLWIFWSSQNEYGLNQGWFSNEQSRNNKSFTLHARLVKEKLLTFYESHKCASFFQCSESNLGSMYQMYVHFFGDAD